MVYLSSYVGNKANICKFADDTKPYSCGYELKEFMEDVEYDFITLVEWFCDNYLTLTADKCHLLALGYKNEARFY